MGAAGRRLMRRKQFSICEQYYKESCRFAGAAHVLAFWVDPKPPCIRLYTAIPLNRLARLNF